MSKIFNKVIEFDAKKGRGYEIKAKSKSAEIWLYEEIGESFFGGVSASQFSKDLKKVGDVSEITLRINSPGGDVFDGLTMYNILKRHPAKVTVTIDGLAASIASIVAMAGDEIHIASNAMMMIHKAWTVTIGDDIDHGKAKDLLQKTNTQLVKTYKTKASIDEFKIEALMAEETWMSSEEALEYGFVTSVVEEMDIAASFDLKKYNYKNIPSAKAKQKTNKTIKSKIASMRMRAGKMKAALNL